MWLLDTTTHFITASFLIFNGELYLNIYSQGEILGVSIFKHLVLTATHISFCYVGW